MDGWCCLCHHGVVPHDSVSSVYTRLSAFALIKYYQTAELKYRYGMIVKYDKSLN